MNPINLCEVLRVPIPPTELQKEAAIAGLYDAADFLEPEDYEGLNLCSVLGVDWDNSVDERQLAELKAEGKELADRVVKEIRLLQKMDVRDYTLYLKYFDLVGYLAADADYETRVEATIAKTMDFSDVERCFQQKESQVEIVEAKPGTSEIEDWLNIRKSVSAHIYSPSGFGPKKYIIKINSKIAGIIEVNASLISMTPRDSYIGFGGKQKDEMLNHLGMAGTAVPIQPFGYMALGGKFLALLLYNDLFRENWKTTRNKVLAGMCTTALYGSLSQYSGMGTYWKELGTTSARFPMYPRQAYMDEVRDYISRLIALDRDAMRTHTRLMKRETNQKAKRLEFFYRVNQLQRRQNLTLKDKTRGVYIAEYYTDTRRFLRGEITENGLLRSEKLRKLTPAEEKEWRVAEKGELDQLRKGPTEGLKQGVREITEKYRTDVRVLDFDPANVHEIFEYWRKMASIRFGDYRQNAEKRQQFFMSVKKPGGIMTVEEFIKKYRQDDTEEGEAAQQL